MFKRDYADEIKRSVDMPRLMSYYGIEYKRAHIKCPIHGGEGDNFRAYKDGFYCFSHCGGGDVIKFVQLYERLDFVGYRSYMLNRAYGHSYARRANE